MGRRLLAAAGITLALCGVAVSAGGAYAYFWDRSNTDVIASGVSIAGIEALYPLVPLHTPIYVG